MKVKKIRNLFIFGLLVGTCCKNLVFEFFSEIYQIKAILSKRNLLYMKKLDFSS
jgi:hypothetical protein